MNKKVMAIAVAGVLAAPASVALAQTSTVQIGGSITAFYYSHSPKNSTTGQRTDIMETSEPEMFVRGEEKLGGGLSAWFQCTSSLDGLINGSTAATAAGFCGRNSGIGFKGSWGNLFLGNWDMPLKFVQNAGRGWWGGTNSLTGGIMVLLGGGSASGTPNPPQLVGAVTIPIPAALPVTAVTGTGSSSFFRRQANTLNYHSPSWNGFTVQGAFSAGNEQTGIPETNALSPRLFSLAGQYRSGPLYLGLGYERHTDFNPAGVAFGTVATAYSGGTDDNWTVVAGYTFAGVFNLRGMYTDFDYDTTNSTSLDSKGWAILADWNIQGPHTLRAQYVSLDDTGGNSAVSVGTYAGPLGAACGVPATSCATATGAKQWGLAYSYAFSKRTMGSIIYTKLDNDRNAKFSKGKVASSFGNSQTSFGIALQHRF